MRYIVFVLVTIVCGAAAWDDGDLEVFDAVEEVNQNFYELMGVKPEATPAEIKSAFKKLTLKLHPDKNDAPDADVQFRNLVSVHNILKDPGKREKYNEVLKNGLPNWRSAVYYYRHVRKMGLAEAAIISFIIISFGQYCVGWAAYAEKRYTAEQILNSRGKKQKKSGFDTGLAEILEQLPKPSVKDTLPFQIPRFIWWSITALPYAIIEIRRNIKEQKEEAIRLKKKEEEEAEQKAAAAAATAALKGAPRRRRGFVPAERECLLDPVGDDDGEPVAKPAPAAPAVISGGLWTDDDLAELVRLVKKYPGGTPDRWERIADAMMRPVPEVTHMAAKMKDNWYKIPGQEVAEAPLPEPPKKVKTRKNEDAAATGGNWSQSQQKALEVALAKYPKGGAGDRWEKIANTVQGKTKEECMHRCKYLSDMVKKQKQKEEEEQREAEETHTDDNDSVSNGT
ncbi:dnaJ homolog subfamily C member 1 [Plutella xylostella]|uniref:dnaJ homolog subfamily C member 1 n=1 Tax=Plutella xylostella TaxID=51655 RepID=UPI002032D3E3|nr:dnaJ homolog subfamily C member 1 [Plutella xylostella]